ncbi:MAG: thiosulfate oxidation carrier complex protein SoxZ [Rhodospirillales bacterium]|nr:thiosulfate oxidation carrier complex protein SoxZ [Rhodospirillales bacterium]
MANAKPRVKLPKSAAKGEIVQIKTLISHKMESGQRVDSKTGEKIPRQIINKFVCAFNGKEVFSADWHGAVSANPYMSFYLKATESGTFEFTWTDDDGSVYTKTAELAVQ